MTVPKFIRKKPILVSVIIPMHKEINLINDCLKSICENKSDEFSIEILVINDGKIDNDIISQKIFLDETMRIKIYRNEFTKGVGGARNTGLKHSKGLFIAFIDVDDIWLPNKLAKQISIMQEGYLFCCTCYRFKYSGKLIEPPKTIISVDEIFSYGGIGTSTVVVHKDLVGQAEFSNLKFGQDIEFWYRLLRHKPYAFIGLNDVGTIYSEKGCTQNKLVQLLHYWRVLQLTHYNLKIQIWLIICYALRGIKNHIR